MHPALRQVTRLPLDDLWDETGNLGRRLRYLTRDELHAIIAQGPVRFVEAHIGEELRWTAIDGCFARWRAVADHIGDPAGFYLEDFPQEFAFVASEWEGHLGERLILLEMHH